MVTVSFAHQKNEPQMGYVSQEHIVDNAIKIRPQILWCYDTFLFTHPNLRVNSSDVIDISLDWQHEFTFLRIIYGNALSPFMLYYECIKWITEDYGILTIIFKS